MKKFLLAVFMFLCITSMCCTLDSKDEKQEIDLAKIRCKDCQVTNKLVIAQ